MKWSCDCMDVTKWHLWWAWYPVNVGKPFNQRWVWLEAVERRKYTPYSLSWQHRKIGGPYYWDQENEEK